jgi:hypothetical protein
MRSKAEHKEQKKLVGYLTLLENTNKIVTFFAVPNGGSRNVVEAKNMKREGVRAGVSDIVVVLRDKVLFIEMKRLPDRLKSGKLSFSKIKTSEKQKEFLKKINGSDVCAGKVCYGAGEAIEYINREIGGKK